MLVWLSGNIVGRINKVDVRRAGLVQRWVTICGYTVLVFNQATQANSAWPSLWVSIMSTSNAYGHRLAVNPTDLGYVLA